MDAFIYNPDTGATGVCFLARLPPSSQAAVALQTPWQTVNQLVQQDLPGTCYLAIYWIICNGTTALGGKDDWKSYLCASLLHVATILFRRTLQGEKGLFLCNKPVVCHQAQLVKGCLGRNEHTHASRKAQGYIVFFKGIFKRYLKTLVFFLNTCTYTHRRRGSELTQEVLTNANVSIFLLLWQYGLITS